MRKLVLLGMLLLPAASTPVPGTPIKHALSLALTGSVAAQAGDDLRLDLAGPVFTTVTDPASGVWQGTGRQVGQVDRLVLHLRRDLRIGNDPVLQLETLAGSLRDTPLFASDNDSGSPYSLPFDGRLLTSLGPVTRDGDTQRLAGCLGVVTGDAGPLAARHGSLCLSGTLTVPSAAQEEIALDSLATLVLQ